MLTVHPKLPGVGLDAGKLAIHVPPRLVITHHGTLRFEITWMPELYAGGGGVSLVAVAGVLTLLVVGPQPLRAVTAHWG